MGPNDPKGSRSYDYLAKALTSALSNFTQEQRGHIVAVIGEFVGTLLFLFFAFAGTQVANISSNNNTGTEIDTKLQQKNPSQLLYVSLSFGFSLLVTAWVFFRISGGLFNPAVTVGMVLIGSITWVRGTLLFVTQILGAIVAAALIRALLPGELNVSTELNPTMSIARGTILEMILTAQLVFTIFMLAAEKHTGTFIAPVGIGLSLFIGELVGVFWTGGSLNPARSFGPSVVTHSFVGYHWIYWVGPLAGTFLAVLLFNLVKGLEYESANPDPESGDLAAAQNGQVQSDRPGPGQAPAQAQAPAQEQVMVPAGQNEMAQRGGRLLRHSSPKSEDDMV